MRGGFGVPYEFSVGESVSAGLGVIFRMPLVYHDALTGHFFARTSWDEDARLGMGYFDGHLQTFNDGKIEIAKEVAAATEPVHVGEAIILSARAKDVSTFSRRLEAVFVLNPHAPRPLRRGDRRPGIAARRRDRHRRHHGAHAFGGNRDRDSRGSSALKP